MGQPLAEVVVDVDEQALELVGGLCAGFDGRSARHEQRPDLFDRARLEPPGSPARFNRLQPQLPVRARVRFTQAKAPGNLPELSILRAR